MMSQPRKVTYIPEDGRNSSETLVNSYCTTRQARRMSSTPKIGAILSRVFVTVDGDLNWILDLLTTYRS
jgi:hypothetical protein